MIAGLVEVCRRDQGPGSRSGSMNLSSLAALPPPRDEEVRERKFQAGQVLVEALAPAAPGEILALAHGVRSGRCFGHHPWIR